MNIKAVPPLFAALVLVAGCNTMKVTSDPAPDFDFGKLQTYQWIDAPADILDQADTHINEDIKQTLEGELARRGLRPAGDMAKADVQVAYYVKLKKEYEYTSPAAAEDRDFSGGFVYTRESKSWSYTEREPDLNVYAIEIGTLALLAYDAETGQRIWRGTLKTEIDRSRPEDNQRKRIRAAAKKLMARFPEE